MRILVGIVVIALGVGNILSPAFGWVSMGVGLVLWGLLKKDSGNEYGEWIDTPYYIEEEEDE